MSRARWSPLAVLVLALLEEESMHPYRMVALLKERGKGEVVNLAERATLYKAIDRLREAGLVTVRETVRDPQRPERTIYEITAEGRATWRAWLLHALATPAREFPELPAALSLIALLGPDQAADALARRLDAQRTELARIEAGIAAAPVPRLFLLEDEHRRDVLRAEVRWVESVVDDLRSGRLTWDLELIRRIAAERDPGE